eukprot:6207418-Pleurochrysis_carterae.AAC.1
MSERAKPFTQAVVISTDSPALTAARLCIHKALPGHCRKGPLVYSNVDLHAVLKSALLCHRNPFNRCTMPMNGAMDG